MKLGLIALSGIAAVASAGGIKGYEKVQLKNFKVGSNAARNLLASSAGDRKMEDYEFSEAFVASHSIIFEECYNSTAWDDGYYVAQTLVRYTLCPTDSCSDGGCSSSYTGEYVVNLETFLDSYLESKMEAIRWKCEDMRETCGCDEDNNNCMYYCYKNYDDDSFDWKSCADEQGEEERYGECQQLEFNDDEEDGDRALAQRKAEYNLYLGPVCSEDGGSINLAVFTDEDCQYEHSSGEAVYEMLSGGVPLPYSTESLIELECVSCLEPKENGDQNDDDYEDEDEVSRFCEESFNEAARCETNLDTGYYYKDETGCNYIAALKAGEVYSYYLGFSGTTFYAALLGGVLAVFAVGAYAYKEKNKFEEPAQYELS